MRAIVSGRSDRTARTVASVTTYRLTQYASGGGCACKIPPGELEEVVRGLTGHTSPDLLVGLDDGDDAAVVRVDDRTAVVATADFFTPVVDERLRLGPHRGGERAVGRLRHGRAAGRRGEPRRLAAVGAAHRAAHRGAARRARRRPRGGLPGRRRPQHRRPRAEVRHGRHRARRPGAAAAQRRRSRRPAADADEAARRRRAEQPPQGDRRGLRPRGREHGVAEPRRLRRGRRRRCAGGDRRHRLRAARPPAQDDAGERHDGRRRRRGGAVPRRRPRGAARRLRQRRHAAATSTGCGPSLSASVDEDELLLLADAQTSGGLLVVGEVPGCPVVGEVVPREDVTLRVR